MKTKHFYYLAVFAVFFVSCEKSGNDLKVTKEVFSGYAQKGPFATGSSVTILELNANFDQTGRNYFTTISDNSGSFEKKNIELVSKFVALKADGYYFNEVSGKTSTGQMTLYALIDVQSVNSANINVLTHLEKPRVEYLITQEGMSFAAAKKQAQSEVLAIFGFEATSETSSETLNLTDNAVLLAISCILQGYLSTGDMMELMANIAADIKTDGKLDDMSLGAKLVDNAYSISLSSLGSVRENLTSKYAELGDNATIPDFESYIQAFLDKDLYSQSLFITYPATGFHGKNILSDDVVSVKKYIQDSYYSMKADVPNGMSLKIVLKDGDIVHMGGPYPPLNWKISYSGREFTVIESGKPNDVGLLINDGTLDENGQSYITIEYYENGSPTPTKVKTLYIK